MRPEELAKLDESPEFGDCGRTLRSYQLDGVNWLLSAWQQRRNVMLADEMGLGKTAQIVATFSELSRTHGVGGPFLVVAPLSILGITAIFALEMLVAFIQAYVFAILTCVYLKDALHPHH